MINTARRRKSFRDNQENKLTNQLTSQGSFFTSISKFSLPQINTIWSTCQSKLPKNIFNFTIRYINNSLPTRRNLQKWGLRSSSECSFCLHPESLLHVVAGCSSYLDRFTWRHDSILQFIYLLFIYLLNFAHTYTYIFLLLKSRLIKIRARDLLETIKGF